MTSPPAGAAPSGTVVGRPAANGRVAATGQVAATGTGTAGPRLVALDVDGTLMRYDGSISVAVLDAVQAVRAAGDHVVLATVPDGAAPAGGDVTPVPGDVVVPAARAASGVTRPPG